MSSSISESADSDLLERFVSYSDEKALEEIIVRHGPMVKSVCRRRLNAVDAEDAFQATFVTLVKKGKWVRSGQSTAGWLYRVALRISIDMQRANSRRRTAPLHESLPDHRARRDALAKSIEEELDRLPANYRSAIVLFHIEGHSIGDAAEILGVTKDQVANWLRRGRGKLKQRLRQYQDTLTFSGLAVGSITVSDELTAQTTETLIQIAAGSTVQTNATLLAERTISNMFWNQLIKTSLLAVIAVGSVVALKPMIGSVNAQDDFYYDEEFLSADSSLGPWTATQGDVAIDESGLRLKVAPWPDTTNPGGMGTQGTLAFARSEELEDLEMISLRTRFKMETTPSPTGRENWVGYYSSAGSPFDRPRTIIAGGLDAVGRTLEIIELDPWRRLASTRLPNGLDLFGGDEIFMQADIGDEFNLYIWKPGEGMPSEPNLSANLCCDYIQDEVGIHLDFNQAEGSILISNITMSANSIPEPAGVSMASTAAILLFILKRRRIGFW